jgi:hypothetical protein
MSEGFLGSRTMIDWALLRTSLNCPHSFLVDRLCATLGHDRLEVQLGLHFARLGNDRTALQIARLMGISIQSAYSRRKGQQTGPIEQRGCLFTGRIPILGQVERLGRSRMGGAWLGKFWGTAGNGLFFWAEGGVTVPAGDANRRYVVAVGVLSR